MIESTVSQRRELDSEKQTKETEEQRKAREVSTPFYPLHFVAYLGFLKYTISEFGCKTSRSPIRNINGSPAVLLRTMRQAVPKRSDI